MRRLAKKLLIKHWRGIVNILTAVAMVLLVYAVREQIVDTLRNLKHVNYWLLLLMLPLQALGYHAYALMYKEILEHLKQPVRYKSMLRVALELNFVNHALPSGGVSGISYFGLRLRAYGVKGSTATLLQFVKFILIFLSFQALLAVGILALAIGGKVNNVMLLFAGVLGTLTLVATVLAVYIISSKQRISDFFGWVTAQLNRFIGLFRSGRTETINTARVRSAMEEMHENYLTMRATPSILRSGLWYGFVVNLCEVLTIYVVYLSFGEAVNIGAVIVAYAVANFAGLVSVLPGGIGIYEALTTAVSAAGGIPAALSIPVVVMYRILNMMLQLVPGWVLYHRWLRGESDNPEPSS